MVYVTNRSHVYVGLLALKLFLRHWMPPKIVKCPARRPRIIVRNLLASYGKPYTG
jgi:hypothetical protein